MFITPCRQVRPLVALLGFKELKVINQLVPIPSEKRSHGSGDVPQNSGDNTN